VIQTRKNKTKTTQKQRQEDDTFVLP